MLLLSRGLFIENATQTENYLDFRNTYSDSYPPAWMLAEILPLGVLTRIYDNIKSNQIRKIMEQKFSNNRLDLETLREFCEREGEAVFYRKGDQLEREGDPARWLAYVTEGCFKYVKYAVSDDKAHITWFSFEGEFVVDYPTFLYGRPAQTTIEAMMPSRVLRVTGQQLEQFFDQSKETMKLRAVIAEHILSQFRSRYLDLHCTTARERYDLLMQRCPGIVELLDLQDIASFLNVHPNTISKIRRDITFEGR